MRVLRSVAAIFLAALLLSIVALAQSQITTGVIEGSVTDPSGAVMANASVEAKNLETNFSRTTTTGADGRFVLLSLPPGPYVVTITANGFATLDEKSITLTVGQTLSLNPQMKVAAGTERVEVTAETQTVETTANEQSTTLNGSTIANTPILGRKFEDLLTLTPGVAITQGPDGDEINFSGQRGIFNNISLDGGDYNNGFFGEQVGGQRAAIDITLDAVAEFQVVASGASAEFGRTASGVVNVITKSGTNDVHGSLFHYQRLEALSSATSDGKPLKNFSREQFGGTVGGPIVKEKMFGFAAVEQIIENLTRPNLSTAIGTPCSVPAPTITANAGLIGSSADCQRLALLNFFQAARNQNEGLPVSHKVRNSAVLAKYDWTLNQSNKLGVSYNFDRSRNENQTFDVPTYGDSANGIEGTPALIHAVNLNLFTTVSNKILNEAHFTYSRENRGRAAVNSNVPADTAMGFATTFRFGQPFFIQPGIDELFWRTQLKDNVSIVSGKHTIKVGAEWLHSDNGQVFRGFFNGRYIFDSVAGFLHYAQPSLGPGYGPNTAECSNANFSVVVFVTGSGNCPAGTAFNGGPLLLYLQGGATGLSNLTPGASDISNQNYAVFIQDKYQVRPNLTLNYGLRWEGQVFPSPVIAPASTAYGQYLTNPLFPSDGKIHNDMAMWQPRVGLAWDVRNNQKSVLRASFGIYNATQNMLTQVGAITTNGVQQQTIAAGSAFGTRPTWPNTIPVPPVPAGSFPFQPGVTVFDRHYKNPRIYAANGGFEQEFAPSWSGYIDLTWSKGVYLTRFVDPNTGPTVTLPTNGDTVNYSGASPFPNLGSVTNTQSSAESLYRGMTIGVRKRLTNGWQMEGNYVLSEDLDSDSNERDPFTFRYFNRFNFRKDYSFSDRDERHKFNFYAYGNLPLGFQTSIRMQAHTAQPITDNALGTGTGAPCSANNSLTRVVAGIDCGRNHLRKDNGYFTFDWRASRPFKFGDRYQLIPTAEAFNLFNNKNNVNPLVTPALFNFDGFLRQGVGDPREVQLSLRFAF